MYVGYEQVIVNPALFGTSKFKKVQKKKVVLGLDLLLLMT